MRWDLVRAAAITGGTAAGAAEVHSVVIDSRQAAPGSLFVALHGERADGHDFASDAARRGASVLVERGRRPADAVGVEVDDTLQALGLLGAARRRELQQCTVLAVTGSSGKTTTKDFIAAALGGGAHAAPHSYNNEIGVPLTLLGAPDEASHVVVEVGSRGAGQITALGPVIEPDVAVVTNVGRAHLEMFGSVDRVLDAKWELVELLDADGVAVLPYQDQRLTGRRTGPMVTFGEDAHADVSFAGIEVDPQGLAEADMTYASTTIRLRMPVPGRHQLLNAAAAAAAAVAAGVDFAAAAARLEHAEISRWRMESVTVPVPGGDVLVVNDAYNANPDSMAAALRTVAAMPGRHVAVLGKMHELGVEEAGAHREAGALASQLGFRVVAVGDDPGLAAGAGDEAVSVESPDAAVAHLRNVLEPGDVVLVKGSRAAGLESVAAALEEVAG